MSLRAFRWPAGAIGLALVTLAALSWLGLRVFVVMTPSMGETAPVGTLVVSQRAPGYRVGDVLTFVRNQRIYTHRLVDVQPDGGFRTRGDLNAVPDAAPVPVGNVLGRAVWLAPGLGWVLLALPWLVAGFVLVHVLSGLGNPSPEWRWAVRINGCTIIFCLVAAWLRPWINLELLAFTPADGPGVLMHLVNTGLFPVDANGTLLMSGQDAVVRVTQRDATGLYSISPTAELTLTQHIAVPMLCLIPFLASMFVRTDGALPRRALDPVPVRRRHPGLVLVLAVAVTAAVTVINTASSLAAFGAEVGKSEDTAGSRTFFTCRNAETSVVGATPYVAYALGASGSTEADLTGNGRSGVYTLTVGTSTSYTCPRDTPKASVTFNGANCLYPSSNATLTNPNVFSLEAWFRTSTKSNGKLIGFGDSRRYTTDTKYDRHIYLDRDGRVVFGVYTTAMKLVYTPAGISYADGQWHHVVATLSSAGESLYVDGSLAMTAPSVTTGQANTGYWKVGCGNLASWQNAATAATGSTTADYSGPSYYTGQLQYAAVYTSALSATQVSEHYLAGRP